MGNWNEVKQPQHQQDKILCAEIITIGDEILRGEIVDSNKALMSSRLHDVEVETRFQTSVLDHPGEMEDAFKRAVGRADIVLVSGGLGPTRDDLTTEVLAKTFGREVVLDAASLETLKGVFSRLGREMSENNTKQAYFPQGAEILLNPVGTAPGFMVQVNTEQDAGAVAETLIFAMPGVPRELAVMLEEQVLPRILSRSGDASSFPSSSSSSSSSASSSATTTATATSRTGRAMRARLLRTFGLGESALDTELKQIAQGDGVELGFRTSFPDNFLRPVVRGANAEEVEAKLDQVCAEIREHLGTVVYGEGEETLAAVAGRMLAEAGATIATAESCTGGLIAELITQVAGASEYFVGGVVAYSNQIKIDQLDVPESLLAAHGAVSEPVAAAMAEGVRARFNTDFGISTTGISGPGGGTETKPVGLVCIGIARKGVATHTENFIFPLDRLRHRTLTAQVALDWVRRSLLGAELVSPSFLQRRGGAAPPDAGLAPKAAPRPGGSKK
ncbi:MAG: nicotinamide-nucleotide amidase [Myxococcota bacterium]